MAEEYTPTTARVAIDFCNAAVKRKQPDGTYMTMEEADKAFDRWLTKVRENTDAKTL